MIIERIKSSRLTGLGLGDIDWTFPIGPVLIFCKDKNNQRILGNLLLEIFYDQKTPLALNTESSKGLFEVWISRENTHYHIQQDFSKKGNEFVRSSTLVIEVLTGQRVSLPATLTLGEYIFGVNLQAFRQGVVVNWPKKNQCDYLSQLVNNLRQGGDEGLSLVKVRASLAGAQKKVNEQKGSMELVKAEYDALRREWEGAHRQQDLDRLLLIEIKNFQENEGILSERIASAQIIQERLALLRQNPDYRELRQLQGAQTQLEERIRTVESNLKVITSESEVDWTVIDNLREECIEWASLQEHVERLAVLAQKQTETIAELMDSLETCRYEGLPKDEDQRLRRAEEERAAAQEELNKLTITKDDLKNIQLIYYEEIANLRDLADMEEVSEADEFKIVQREKRLRQWQNSKIGCSLDRTLQKLFSGTSIWEKLASRLGQYYESHRASNFEEFTSRLKDFRDQKKLIERLQTQIEQLQEKAGREDRLQRKVQSRTKLLKQAFLAAKVADLSTWLNGWEDYLRRKHQLALKKDELQLLLEHSSKEKIKIQSCAGQLREKLGDWDTPATDRDEVLATVFKVATQLRAKDEAEKENAAYSQKFNNLLGDRDLERLAKKLDPLADLERESCVSDEERLTELTAWQKDRLEIRKKRAEAERRLQNSQKFPPLTALEKKIETVKRQWMAYEDLHSAIDDAQVILEASWQEWQTKFGKALNNEVQWILSKIRSSAIRRDGIEAMREYFAYRMAIAQLSLGSYVEVPLLFSVGDIEECEGFWIDVIEYFRILSLTKQMILITSDLKLREKLTGFGWSSFNMG